MNALKSGVICPDASAPKLLEQQTVKALGKGKVGGYLVRFTSSDDPDLAGDFFTKNTDLGIATTVPIHYNHGFDKVIGARRLGVGKLRRDPVGMWVEAQLEMRDQYEQFIYELARTGKLSWSSGSSPTLVSRREVGKTKEILTWPIVEASLTPHPAEARNVAEEIKSIDQVWGEGRELRQWAQAWLPRYEAANKSAWAQVFKEAQPIREFAEKLKQQEYAKIKGGAARLQSWIDYHCPPEKNLDDDRAGQAGQ